MAIFHYSLFRHGMEKPKVAFFFVLEKQIFENSGFFGPNLEAGTFEVQVEQLDC